jgi:putative ABC transport system permease protein
MTPVASLWSYETCARGRDRRSIAVNPDGSREYWLDRSDPLLNTILSGTGVSLVVNFGDMWTAGRSLATSAFLSRVCVVGPVTHAFYDEVLRRARSVPGVELAAISDSLPPDREGDADSFQIEGQTLAAGEMNPVVSAVTASPDFFPALRIPLVKGRYFTHHDHQGTAPVAIVSEGFARRFFPDREPIGKRIRQGRAWMEIVGVVGTVKYRGLTFDTDAAYYMPFAQEYGQRMYLVVRSSGDAAHLAETLRREIQSIDAGVTLAQIGTMEQALDLSVSRPRFNTMLLSLFAGIALLLAAVGIYGLIAYWVAQRTHEIGVRMALGAAPTGVMRMVLGQGASLAAAGIVIGLSGAFALTRSLKTMLFGIGVTDALTFAAAPLGIMLVVLLATFVPALRATRISPVVALRYE